MITESCHSEEDDVYCRAKRIRTQVLRRMSTEENEHQQNEHQESEENRERSY